jgi:AraC-like DNA-binding protein
VPGEAVLMEAKGIHLVKAAFHAQFKTAMENCGISANYYFNKVKLPTEVSDHESLLPVKPFYQLINMVAVDENIPDFGSRVAQVTPWHKVSSLGPLIQNSPDLKHLLETFCEIGNSQSSSVLFTLIDEGSHFAFCYTNTLRYKRDIQMELYRITSMIQLVQLATSTQWRPESIRLLMPGTETVDACSILAKSKISFSQPISAISIQRNLLQLPVHIVIPGRIKTDRNKAGLHTDFSNSIRQIINTYTLTKNISIEEVANIADMSVRSLQRRLTDSGLKFNDLLNQAKYRHAKQKLQNYQLPMTEIAKSLGYSDPAHFTRAFRRWSGLSPTDFRKRS